MLGLNAEDSARGQNRVVNMCQTTVGAGEDEILQQVRGSGVQNLVYLQLASFLRNHSGDMRGGCPEYQRQEECCGNCDDKQADSGVGQASNNFSIGCCICSGGWQNHQSACGGKRIGEKSTNHQQRLGPTSIRCILFRHVFNIYRLHGHQDCELVSVNQILGDRPGSSHQLLRFSHRHRRSF